VFVPLMDENPTRRFPAVTILLIAINAAVFLLTALSPRRLGYYIVRFGAIPFELTHFTSLPLEDLNRANPPTTLLASMFLHGGFFHLAGNMLYLWIFGNNVEDFLGSFRFLLFYLAGGAAAGYSHALLHPGSFIPMIGASGAVAAVLGAYFILYPRARVKTWVFVYIVPIPAAVVLGLWFVIQLLNAGGGGGSVAWFAHIGGFLAGIALLYLMVGKRRPRPAVSGPVPGPPPPVDRTGGI
jgi:membrane associated rhomboid family serine protease